MNWQELYSFASKQALLGLCFEDIERLGEEYPDNLQISCDFLGGFEEKA